MKTLVIVLFMSLFVVAILHAQIGKVGINTTTPEAMLHVKDSSVLFSGATGLPLVPGPPPVSGPGARMMWYTDKAAFRVGLVNGSAWDQQNIGTHSFATGFNTIASGEYASAVGLLASATGTCAIALGSLAEALNVNTIAIGTSVKALAPYTTAIGRESQATGIGSTVLGYNNIASGDYAMAMGVNTDATGQYSTAFGQGSQSTGINATAFGYQSVASHINAVAMGNSTAAIGYAATATGSFTIAAGAHAFAGGYSSRANGQYATAFGYTTNASGYASTAIGHSLKANGFGSFAVGMYNDTIVPVQSSVTSQTPLFIVGNGSSLNARTNAMVVRKDGRVGIGTNVPLARLHVRDSSVVFSGSSIAVDSLLSPPPVSGPGLRMMWYADKGAFRAGRVTSTQWNQDSVGLYSYAGGYNTLAKGHNSFAHGNNATARGVSSAALGAWTISSGPYAFTAGYTTKASDAYGLAAGCYTQSNGAAASALGNATFANSPASLTTGFKVTANGYASTVIGMYNDTLVAPEYYPTSSTPVFIIGNGNSETARSNALIVRRDGHVGIGTNNPEARLDVHTSTPNVIISRFVTSGGFGEIAVGNSTHLADLGAYNGGGYTGTLLAGDFHIRTNATSRIFIKDSTGHVGIGTLAPAHRLHTFVPQANAQIAKFESTNGYGEILVGNYSGLVDLGVVEGNGYIGTKSEGPFHLRTGAVSRIIIAGTTGNVGINTLSPTERLDVDGNVRISGNAIIAGMSGTDTRPVVVSSSGQLQSGISAVALSLFENHTLPEMTAPAVIAADTVSLSSGNYLLLFSGSAYRASIGSMRMQINIKLNGEIVHTTNCDMTVNHVMTHTAFPSVFSNLIVESNGEYIIEVFLTGDATYSGIVDYNDRISLLLLRLPA